MIFANSQDRFELALDGNINEGAERGAWFALTRWSLHMMTVRTNTYRSLI
jgi:hypothetical protein